MAPVAMFYHLIQAGLDDTISMILNRAYGQGWRLMLRSPDQGLLQHLDDKLWLGPEDGFLPHGLAIGSAQDADQPILLGPGPIANSAKGLFLLGGAEVDQSELPGLERIWLLFDGAAPDQVQAARGQWSKLTGWGLAAQYWSDETGAWVKKVEKAAPATA